MKTTYYLTTPIYYVNAAPHLGHLYTTVVADCLRLHFLQKKRDVFFLTGTDEHGRNIEKAAQAAGRSPQEHVDLNVAKFQQMIADFDLKPSRFIRTTEPAHKAGAQQLFEALQRNGHVYKGHYDGLYCVPCNQFYTSTEAVEPPGGTEKTCPVHGTTLELVKEESYFFKLASFQDKLLEHYRSHPRFIRPESKRNEVITFVAGGLEDLSISRTSVKWGVPVPNDPAHTLYVWLDALSNYITALGYGNKTYEGFDKFWPADLHLVGKDILRFHTVYWPAFLMAAGIPLPESVYAHGMWISGGRKMSKTLGNVIDLQTLRANFSIDAIRYFLFREKSFGDDADFNYRALLRRYNGDLASGLGNLSSRTLTLIQNGLGGQAPTTKADEHNDALVKLSATTKQSFVAAFEELEFNVALQLAWKLIGETDQFLQKHQPWVLAKQPEKRDELAQVLGTACEVLRQLAVLLYPVMPTSMVELWKQLGLKGSPGDVDPLSLEWGQAPPRAIGMVSPIYQRLKEELLATLETPEAAPSPKTKANQPASASAATTTPSAQGEGIDFDDFMKVDLRVGMVKTAELVKGSDKLLRLEVDLAEESPRQILAGIAQAYQPQDLPGQRVLVVANLRPRKIRGLESRGMLLASEAEDGKPHLIAPPETAIVGTRVR